MNINAVQFVMMNPILKKYVYDYDEPLKLKSMMMMMTMLKLMKMSLKWNSLLLYLNLLSMMNLHYLIFDDYYDYCYFPYYCIRRLLSTHNLHTNRICKKSKTNYLQSFLIQWNQMKDKNEKQKRMIFILIG